MTHLVTYEESCPMCKQRHKIFECDEFRKVTPKERFELAKDHKLCYNCLSAFHGRNCKAGSCKKCGEKHNTLLHFQQTGEKQMDTTSSRNGGNNIKQNVSKGNKAVTTCHLVNSDPYVFLATAWIYIYDKMGKAHECRVLLDNGSQSNFVTTKLCKKLKLSTENEEVRVSALGRTVVETLKRTQATISSKINSFTQKLQFMVMDEITGNMPNREFVRESFEIPDNIILADPEFDKPAGVDMLLGAGIFWDLMSIGQIKLKKTRTILQKTLLGWVVSGQVVYQPNKGAIQCYLSQNTSLETQLQRFWALEEVPTKRYFTPEETAAEEHFVSTFERNEEGRFVVQLPFKESPEELGDSYKLAERRLRSMERKFVNNKELKQQYSKFMKEYLELGHMKEVEDISTTNETLRRDHGYYLPHHAVFKETDNISKIRVVFDASMKTESGKSLNDLLVVGPTIQRDLFDIMTRFRQHTYVISADVVKMYRQVIVAQEHRKYQRILWRFDSSEAIKTYELNTVTYGQASSSFLAIRSLHQIAVEAKEQYPEAAEVISRDFYVDDFMTGAEKLEDAMKLKREITQILETAKFELGKWKANAPELEQNDNVDNLTVEMSDGTKILGSRWNTCQDTFSYKVKLDDQGGKLTKRKVLSCVSQIFDPLGLVAPAMIRAKIIMQSLWKIKAGWDESLPMEVHTRWIQWCNDIQHLNDLVIPRHAICIQPTRIEIHGFSDASEEAYGACIYLLSIDNQGNRQVELLNAKSRVAPLQKVTLAKLELCGALLLAKLYVQTRQSLTVDVHESYFWSDSTVTLSWIAGHPSKWHTFVANRVSEIQQLTNKEKWKHVRTESNPADLLTRGIEASKLINYKLWWNGPDFLKSNHEDRLSDASYLLADEQMPERKKKEISVFLSTEDQFDVFAISSSLTRLKRILAYCRRFIHNIRIKLAETNGQSEDTSRLEGPLNVQELADSMKILIRLAQKESFYKDFKNLQEQKCIDKQSKLATLCPFLDNGIMRIGGRLKNANLAYDNKHPIIMPSNHRLTTMLIREQHLREMHLGPQSLMSVMRSQYWILGGKSTIRKVLHQCIVCFRAQPKNIEQLMGDLPSARVNPSPPFTNTGVDFAGPFSIKLSRNKTGKAYLCVFVCLATKALHLEVVSDLSTPAFLNTLKRFIARRGKPSVMFSDNGTNFVGASNSLRDIYKVISKDSERIHDFLADQAVEWRFIPPLSPHMGGLWESAVKSCKMHLKKICSPHKFSFEELTTLIAQIESILNSRPLTPMSTDPDDPIPLTPGHFLIGRPLNSIPEPDLIGTKLNRLTRYELLTQIKQSFWKRWSTEYLSQLQRRTKWNRGKVEITLDSLVVIKDSNLPPMQWRTGRIVKLYPGSDDIVRIVDVKTANGVYKRSINKLCILPIASDDKF